MMHKAWSSIEEVPYCFPSSSVNLQGRTALKIVEFDPNWAFPDCNSNLNSPMGTEWCTKLEVALRDALLFLRVIRKISRSHGSKHHRIWPKLGVSGLKLQFEFTNGYEMMHKAWSSTENVPYCFSRSYVKLQGHTAPKIVDFDTNWAFPGCNSSLNSLMDLKWCTKLDVI